MSEQQPQSTCPHCGYPVEIAEHAPGCPNAITGQEDSQAHSDTQSQGVSALERKFADLGISGTTEHQDTNLQDVDPVVRDIGRRSLENIRQSVAMFFDHYSVKGVYDWKSHTERSQTLRVQLLQERGVKDGQQIPWQIGREVDEQVSRQLSGPETIHIDPGELDKQILAELQAVRKNSRVTYNASAEAFERIMASGRIVPMKELPEDEQAQQRKTGGLFGEIGGADNEGYDERRRQTEIAMGIAGRPDGAPVYAAIHGGSDVNIDEGAAPQFGDFVFELDEGAIKRRTVFTEGDSMNPMGMIGAIRSKEKMSERNGVRERQLSWEHAELALALYNVSRRIDEKNKTVDTVHMDLSAMVKYIEAQVLGGVALSDVKRIVINSWEMRSDLDRYRNEYPRYAGKITLGEGSHERVDSK